MHNKVAILSKVADIHNKIVTLNKGLDIHKKTAATLSKTHNKAMVILLLVSKYKQLMVRMAKEEWERCFQVIAKIVDVHARINRTNVKLGFGGGALTGSLIG